MTDTMTFQNIDLSSWDTLYMSDYNINLTFDHTQETSSFEILPKMKWFL